MKISLVFSFRNEEGVLEELVNRLEIVFESLNSIRPPPDGDNPQSDTSASTDAKSLPAPHRYAYDVIFVNDDSTDRSLDILQKIRGKNRNIKIINMSRRFGVAPCQIAGFRHATGDAVIYMDTDLQDPPEIIPQLIAKWEEGFDVVHTTRTQRKGESAFRIFLTRLAYKIVFRFAEIKIPTNSGDFKLLSRRVVNYMIEANDADPYIRGLSPWIGFNQTRVFYERAPRFKGPSHFPLIGGMSAHFRELIKGLTSFSDMPLWLALFAGILLIAGTVVVSVISFGISLGCQAPIHGYLLMCMFMSFLTGLILFSNGLLGLYVAQIHKAVKNRRQYIIDNKIGFEDDHETD